MAVDDPRGTFSNDRRLTDQEKDTLIAWVDQGAKQGDPKDLPPVPKFTEGWEIGTPDVVLSMQKPYEVPAKGRFVSVFPDPHELHGRQMGAGD